MGAVARLSLLSQGRNLVKHVVPAVLRPLHTLWHEVIGFLFLALAAWAVPSGIRSIREFDGDLGSFVRIILIAVFVAIMGGYGVSSFLRARKISRS
jgi:hypothetical protein